MKKNSGRPLLGPRRFSESELRRVGVAIANEKTGALRCVVCRSMWTPERPTGERRSRNYWHCWNGCNTPS
jgi:hypothetical protein